MTVTFNRKLRKWGGSIVCAFPDEALKALNLKELDEVDLSVVNGVIVVRNPLLKEENPAEFIRVILPSGSRLISDSMDLKLEGDGGAICFIPKTALTLQANSGILAT